MKVALFLVDGFEDIEALMVVDLLRRANIKIDTISLDKKDFIKSSHDVFIRSDYQLESVDILSYDAYILPGGPGYVSYFNHPLLKDIIINAYNNHKLIGAICAAPLFLASLGLLKETTIYPDMQKELAKLNVACLIDKIVVNDNIITAQAMGSAYEFGLAIIKYLAGNDKAIEIKKSIYY